MDATPFLPETVHPSLLQIHEAAQSCKGCPLYRNATQAVTAERGDHTLSLPRAGTPLLLVGEQPGNQEDQQGHPFVGPAGQLLNRALETAGVNRAQTTITNAVKHFKWITVPGSNRHLHAKPTTGEVRACRPWLELELTVIKPRVIVCLGATAAQSLLGPAFRITKSHGKPVTGTQWASTVLATYHPSAILRAPDHEAREKQFNALVADLSVAAAAADLSK